MPSAPKQRKIAIVGSRSVGKKEHLFHNPNLCNCEELTLILDRKIFPHGSLCRAPLRGKLLPYNWEHIQPDYQAQWPGLRHWDRRHCGAGRWTLCEITGCLLRLFILQDEYSILNSKHFIGIHGYIIVYSVASRQSFDMVRVIRDKILNHLVSHCRSHNQYLRTSV